MVNKLLVVSHMCLFLVDALCVCCLPIRCHSFQDSRNLPFLLHCRPEVPGQCGENRLARCSLTKATALSLKSDGLPCFLWHDCKILQKQSASVLGRRMAVVAVIQVFARHLARGVLPRAGRAALAYPEWAVLESMSPRGGAFPSRGAW